jgi:hypothetical protein
MARQGLVPRWLAHPLTPPEMNRLGKKRPLRQTVQFLGVVLAGQVALFTALWTLGLGEWLL